MIRELAPGVVVCGPGPMVERRREPQGERWCFQCRRRVDFDFVVRVEVEPSYWGPDASVECRPAGHIDGDLFPGRSREWDA